MNRTSSLEPAPAVAAVAPYAVPRARAPVDLRLDGNEGAEPPEALLHALAGLSPSALARYPDAAALTERLAARLGVSSSSVLVTAGADEALDRICRALLTPGREVVLPVPGFEMMPRYARLAGAEVVEVPWPGERFPVAEVRAAIGERTALVVLTSPNNPTGAVVPADALYELAAAAPRALFVVDEAYGEFAEDDLARAALSLDNALLVRTLSKAWGLAGLRVGYAAGPPEVIGWLKAAGSPYPVSAPSLALAAARLDEGEAAIAPFVERVREERRALTEVLTRLGAEVVPSQANFVFARLPRGACGALFLRDALAGLGVAVRAFPGRAGCEDAVRVSCPGDQPALGRVLAALETALAPEALLFDLDGVLADVRDSYRAAIEGTAARFGVTVSPADVEREKAKGGANDDWELTWRLVQARGVDASLADVTQVFEDLYQGTGARPGLKEREALLVERDLLARLRSRVPLGVVTGRPRGDARAFLERWGLSDLFDVVITREDAPLKPSPAPVALALERLGVQRAWMLGDTPDDVAAARGARVLPLGVLPPGAPAGGRLEDALFATGAARVLPSAALVEELLP